MVILEETLRPSLPTDGSPRYIRPAPLSPGHEAADIKSSPLALLRRTCSQIGLSDQIRSDQIGLSDQIRSDQIGIRSDSTDESPREHRSPAFKPYDLETRQNTRQDTRQEIRQNTKLDAKRDGGRNCELPENPPARGVEVTRSPHRSPAPVVSPSAAPSPGPGASPILRPGAEVLSSCGSKDMTSLRGCRVDALPPLPLAPLPLPPGAELMSAALRPSLPALPGLYPPAVPPHPGDKCVSPYCACAMTAGMHGYGALCPAGCVMCEHTKVVGVGLPYGPGLGAPLGAVLGAPLAYLPLGAPLCPPSGPPLAPAAGPPSACSWVVDGRQCGKRFTNTGELMQHLRTHTASPGGELALPALPPAYPTHLLAGHRSPFTPPPPPAAGGRYHPYAKMGTTGLGLPPPPPPPPAIYFSPYTGLYAARPPPMP